MFRTNPSREFQPETVNIEDLVPQDHLLRKINETIDFSFIAEKCRPLYCQDNGRPCIDPVMLFKMLLIGYLYGIRSRSEEHTSELQSRPHLVCRLLLEKKKKKKRT